MMWANKLRSFFFIGAVALSIGLISSVSQLHLVLNSDVQERLQQMHGSADMRISASPPLEENEDWSRLEPASVQAIMDMVRVEEVGQAIDDFVIGEGQTDAFLAIDFPYAGVDNAAVTKSYYRFEQDLSPYEVALSDKLAERLGVSIGQTVDFPLESGRTVEWVVSELLPDVEAGLGFPEERALFHFDSLQATLGLEEPQSLVLSLQPNASIPGIIEEIRQLEDGIQIDVLHGLESYIQSNQYLQYLGYVLSILAFVAAVLMTLGTMQVSYRERQRELAIIRTSGGSPKQLGKIVLYETGLLAAIGVGAGVLLGWLVSIYGIYWIADMLDLELLLNDGYELSAFRLLIMLVIALFGWLTLMLAALSLVWKVSGIEPIESFRQEERHAEKLNFRVKMICLSFLGVGIVFALTSFVLPSFSSVYIMMFIMASICIIIAWLSTTVLWFQSLQWLVNNVPFIRKK